MININIDTVFDGVTHIIAAASLITAVMPVPDKGTFLAKLYRLIEYLALITDKVKNAKTIKSAPSDKTSL